MKSFHLSWLIVLVLPLLLMGCKGGGSDPSRSAGGSEYEVRGTVVAVNPAKPSVTLDHEDIPGLMKAMTMEFDVESPAVVEGIITGDRVLGRLKKGDSGYVVTRVQKRTGQ